jgi:hypothetical protein
MIADLLAARKLVKRLMLPSSAPSLRPPATHLKS